MFRQKFLWQEDPPTRYATTAWRVRIALWDYGVTGQDLQEKQEEFLDKIDKINGIGG